MNNSIKKFKSNKIFKTEINKKNKTITLITDPCSGTYFDVSIKCVIASNGEKNYFLAFSKIPKGPMIIDDVCLKLDDRFRGKGYKPIFNPVLERYYKHKGESYLSSVKEKNKVYPNTPSCLHIRINNKQYDIMPIRAGTGLYQKKERIDSENGWGFFIMYWILQQEGWWVDYPITEELLLELCFGEGDFRDRMKYSLFFEMSFNDKQESLKTRFSLYDAARPLYNQTIDQSKYLDSIKDLISRKGIVTTPWNIVLLASKKNNGYDEELSDEEMLKRKKAITNARIYSHVELFIITILFIVMSVYMIANIKEKDYLFFLPIPFGCAVFFSEVFNLINNLSSKDYSFRLRYKLFIFLGCIILIIVFLFKNSFM